MTTKQVNGEKPSSVTLDHIVSYPFVSDTLYLYQQNTYGAKSIELAHSLYSNIASPIIPYLQTPYSIVSPYLAKVDSVGDSTLNSVDSQFPGLKCTDLSTIKSQANYAAHYPFKLAGDGKEYVFNTYNDEYQKAGGQTYGHAGKAVINTELRIVAETMHAVADWMGPKKQQAEEQWEALKKQGEEKARHVKRTAQEKKEQAMKAN